MKKNKLQLTNPIPYTVDMLIRNLNVSVKVQNPDGLNQQFISIKYKRKKSKGYDPENEKYELTESELEYIKYYLEAEGFLEAARQHNLYFENEK
jgi:hypothetical protein